MRSYVRHIRITKSHKPMRSWAQMLHEAACEVESICFSIWNGSYCILFHLWSLLLATVYEFNKIHKYRPVLFFANLEPNSRLRDSSQEST